MHAMPSKVATCRHLHSQHAASHQPPTATHVAVVLSVAVALLRVGAIVLIWAILWLRRLRVRIDRLR
jgi:hypothetical protein